MSQFTGLFSGLTTIDIQYFVDSFPVPNRKVKTDPPEILVGGPATNAAVAFAYLNEKTFLISALGNNAFSGFVAGDLTKNRVTHFDLIPNQRQNAVMASVVTSGNNGDRTVFTHHPHQIEPEVNPEKLLAETEPNIVLMDGFYPEFNTGCAQIAKKYGIPLVLDCGSWKKQYSSLLPFTEVAICSADFLPPGCNSHESVFSFLREKGVKKIAISRGEKSLLFQDEKGRGEVAIEKTNVMDTLGAGDFFHGAFCYYFLLYDGDFVKALKYASRIATFSCQYKGTREWLNYTI